MNFLSKHCFLLLGILCLHSHIYAQYVYTIKADSVKITNCDSAELILENHTQGIPGFLFNTGNGRTIFKRALQQINDSLYLVGADTLHMPAGLKWYKESQTPAGSNNYTVTGPYAVAIAGQNNTVYGINSAIVSGSGSVAGGDNSYGVGDNSMVAGGFENLDSCVDCVIIGGDNNTLHPSAVNSCILGTGWSSIYPFNSFIASASFSGILGPSGNNGIGETIIGGGRDSVKGDGGQVFGGMGCNSYSYGEIVMGMYSTNYTPVSTTYYVPTDRLFNIGNGTSAGAMSDAFTILKNGNTTINGSAFVKGKSFLGGTTSPTAVLHLAAGSATAGSAPLKLTGGSLLTSAEDGAIEYDGTDYYITQGTSRYKLSKTLTAEFNSSFGGATINPSGYATDSLSVPGVSTGDVVTVNANSGAANPPSIIITAYVTTAGTVTVRAYNAGNSAITLSADTFNIRVIK
jgi:hypothetical protein